MTAANHPGSPSEGQGRREEIPFTTDCIANVNSLKTNQMEGVLIIHWAEGL